MKSYLKILLITLAIQLGGLAISKIIYDLSGGAGVLSGLRVVIVFLCVLASVIVDIVLAIRWGTGMGKKLMYIFLMPTNYLWLVWLLWASWYVGQWIDMIMGIYP